MRCLACLLILCLCVHAQEPQDVVRISTNLVQVDVVVSKNGKQVSDLKLEDFEIREDGRVQQITNFAFVSVNSNPTKPTPGTPSRLTATAPAPPQPYEVKRTVAIVVDDLGMSFESMANLRQYLRKFVSESLRKNDLVAIVRTGGEVGALQQFTTDPRVLASAIAELKWNPCSRVGTSVLSPERSLITMAPPEAEMRGRVPADRSPGSNQVQRQTTANESNPCSTGNSVNYSLSAIRFILRGMQDLPGRKSLLLVSDNLPMERQENAPADFGFQRPVMDYANLIDVWTQSTVFNDGLHGLAEQAIRSSVVIYGVSSQRLQTTGVQPSDELGFPPQTMVRGRGGVDVTQPNNNPLSRLMTSRSAELQKNFDGAELLAKETGGFVIRNTNDFGVDRVLEDQNGYYLIGYRPAAETFKRQLHKIQVRVKRSGFAVRTRAGFYGVTQAAATVGALSDSARMSRAVSSPFGANEITMRLSALFANDPVRGSMLRTFVLVDAKDITFTTQEDGSRMVRLHLMGVLFNENGAVVDRPELNVSQGLNDELYERAQREGLAYSFDVPLKRAGAFQLRVAVRDLASQRIGASGQFVQAPDLSKAQFALSSMVLYADRPNIQSRFDDEWRSLVLRTFNRGASLVFGYTIYNAALDEKTQQPQLVTQTVVYRDSVKIYSSDRTVVATAGQQDLKRIAAGARLQLGSALTPGEYVVQIVVEDQVAKRTTTQVTPFEVK